MRNFKYGNFVNGRGYFCMNYIGLLFYYFLFQFEKVLNLDFFEILFKDKF